jgi:transcriptional regulator with XRE-family HTH domain
MNIGEKVRKIRVSLGMTQTEFAEKLGLKQSYISKVEKDHANLTVAHIHEIAGRFNVDVSNLLQDNDVYVSESTPPYQAPMDPLIVEILWQLQDLGEKDKRSVLTYIEERKLLARLAKDIFK